jgi:glyoxylase-like metal-dependent hydrolase (beta-lactamase superfamily II)
MKPVKITERNIMFTQPMGKAYNLNTGLILGDKYNYVIDTALGSGSVQPVLDYISENGAGGKPFAVINTHCHWDHIWGNFVFCDSIIIAHYKCRELMDKYWDDAIRDYGSDVDGEAHKCLPNLVIYNESLYFPDDGIKITYTPGHSIDCVSVFDEKEKILYAGDNIGDTESDVIPYIDTDIETMAKTIEVYKGIDFATVVSGHNKPQGKDVIAKMEAALAEAWKKQIEKYGMPEGQ